MAKTSPTSALEIAGSAPCKAPAVVGHDLAWNRMLGAFSGGKGGQGYILSGPQGVGKATFAYRAARALLPPDDAGAAEREKVDRLVGGLAHPDLLALESARETDARPALPVSEIRRAVRFLARTAAAGGRRIVLIDKADHLNRNAANALLKVLEEPPRGTVLMLVADVAERLLPTLRSRCQILRFDPLPTEQVANILHNLARRDALSATDAEIGHAAELSAGSPGTAFRILTEDLAQLLARIDTWMDVAVPAKPLQAQQIAADISCRDVHAAFALTLDRLRHHLHSVARNHAAAGGDPSHFALFWRELAERQAETEAFNLDRMSFALWAVNRARELIEPATAPS